MLNIESIISDFTRDGFVLLPEFVSSLKIARWNQAFAPLLLHHIEHHGDPSFRGANRYYVTLPFAEPFADPEIYDSDELIKIIERLAGEDFVMCQLASDTPTLGSDYQAIHSDARLLFPEQENL